MHAWGHKPGEQLRARYESQALSAETKKQTKRMETAEDFFVELCGKVLPIFRNRKNRCNILLVLNSCNMLLVFLALLTQESVSS